MELEYGPVGFTLGSGISVSNINTNSYHISNLDDSTQYDVYLQAICDTLSSGFVDLSTWSSSLMLPYGYLFDSTIYIDTAGLSLNCSSNSLNETIVYSDDLESQGNWTGDFGTGNGYWKVNSGGTTSPGTGPSGAQSGSNYFYFEASSGGLDTASIISPVIDLTNVTSQAILYFYYHFYGTSGSVLDVEVTTDNINFTTLSSYSNLQNDNLNPFAYKGVDLSSYIGQGIRLRFKYSRGSQGTSYQGDIAIDLVEVKACSQTGNCIPPSNLSAHYVDSNSTNLSWNAVGNQSSWELEYGLSGQARTR